tara:strand:- start:1769 stop:2278 length:510 start_codon:yes stop_codon:yes gene_type:complete
MAIKRGAGILPFARHKGSIYLFLGRENKEGGSSAAGKWSDFGGSKEGNESEFETALREGSEELSGIFGDMDNLSSLVNKTNIIIKTKTFYTYLMEVNYDPTKPIQLKTIYNDALENTPELVHTHNGLYEKDRGIWLDIEKAEEFRPELRRWYNYMMTKIISYFKNDSKI